MSEEPEQPSLFDAQLGEAMRDEGIKRAMDNADPEWRSAAYLAVVLCAREHDEFATDDVWRRLASLTDATTHENRAIAGCIRKAAKNNVIAATDRYRKSTLPQQHRRGLQVWRSLIR